jgi:hypothetical protein
MSATVPLSIASGHNFVIQSYCLMSLFRRPSAFLPIVISILMMLAILVHIARFGTAPQPDEGAAAHLFQVLMPVQVLIIVLFAVSWLRKNRAAWVILATQCAAALSVLATVFFLRW